jgi:hypothetical protein
MNRSMTRLGGRRRGAVAGGGSFREPAAQDLGRGLGIALHFFVDPFANFFKVAFPFFGCGSRRRRPGGSRKGGLFDIDDLLAERRASERLSITIIAISASSTAPAVW